MKLIETVLAMVMYYLTTTLLKLTTHVPTNRRFDHLPQPKNPNPLLRLCNEDNIPAY